VRVLQIITTLSVGGAETMLRNVALGLPRDRFDQQVISLTAVDVIGEELRQSGVQVTALGGRGGVLWPSQISQARALLQEWRPHVIHTWMYHANLVGRLLLALEPEKSRPGFIASVRGALNSPSTQKRSLRAVRWMDARASRAADSIIFNSKVSAGQHQAIGYDPHTSVVIPNGFDVAKFAPDENIRQRLRAQMGLAGRVFGMVARYEPVKGHAIFLQAAALARASGARFQIVFAGRNCDERNAGLTALIQELGLTDSVKLLGERRDVPELLNAFDFVVCPSLSESFPNAVGEAMSCAVPCLVTDVGDCAYLVGDAGFVVAPADPAAMAAKLVELIGMEEGARISVGKHARDRIIQGFSMAAALQRYGELYEATQRAS